MKNNKGFILIELLVVAVFTSALFTFLYVNVIPLIGDYEKEERYDTVETKYILYDIRKSILEFDDDTWTNIKTKVNNDGLARLYCYNNNKIHFYNDNCDTEDRNTLSKVYQNYDIKSLYISRYGVGKYNDGYTPEGDSYKSLKTEVTNNNYTCTDECSNNNINYLTQTEEYIKSMKSYTLGYEFKSSYYRIIACMTLLDDDKLYCGSIELMR